MSLKKIFIILIVLLVLVVGFLIAYNYFFKEEEPTKPTTGPASSTELKQAGRIKTITQESILSPIADGQKVKYYLMGNGNVFESDFDGSDKTRVSANLLTDLLKALWSPQRDKVIAIFDDGGEIKKYLYDYQTEKATQLDSNIRHITWSPNQDKIAYQYYNPQTEDNNISIANPDGSNWTNILATRMKNLIVEWPNSSQLSIRTRPSGLAQSVVYSIDLANGHLQKLISETYGLTVIWSPQGDKILFSETDERGKNLKLKIANLAKQTTKELDFVTLPEKCVWSQDNRTIFCAVPKNISTTATLPDDYYKGLVVLADNFWRVNLDTGEKIQIYPSAEAEEETMSYDAQQLLLSPLEDYLIFINKLNSLLYSLEL